MVTLIYTTSYETDGERDFHSLSAAIEWLKGFNQDYFWVLYAEMSVIDTESGEDYILVIDGYEEIMNYEN